VADEAKRFGDPDRGLEMIRKDAPALIFLDLLMPVMGGLEFLQELKPQPEDPFKVVVITGHGDDGEIRRCYELGVDFFLRKPLSLVEVQCLAKRCLAMKQLEMEKAALIAELRKAANTIKDLKQIMPICASCKKIRLDNGYWQEVEVFFQVHAEMDFSHSICPACIRKLYPEINLSK
jgi:CheY-like chemotaxis protein